MSRVFGVTFEAVLPGTATPVTTLNLPSARWRAEPEGSVGPHGWRFTLTPIGPLGVYEQVLALQQALTAHHGSITPQCAMRVYVDQLCVLGERSTLDADALWTYWHTLMTDLGVYVYALQRHHFTGSTGGRWATQALYATPEAAMRAAEQEAVYVSTTQLSWKVATTPTDPVCARCTPPATLLYHEFWGTTLDNVRWYRVVREEVVR